MALCRWRWPVRPTPPAWSSTIPRPDRCTAISCVEPGQKYTQRDRLVTISSIISFDFFRLTPEINRLRTTSSPTDVGHGIRRFAYRAVSQILFFGSFEPVLSAAADCEYADTGERHNHGDR